MGNQQEEDDLEDEVENMKKAFTVSDTMVSAVSSSDLQLNTLQRLQQPDHCRQTAEDNGHDMIPLGLQRASYETEQARAKYDTARRSEAERRHERLKGREYKAEEERGKTREEKGVKYDNGKRHETSRRTERLKGREISEEISDSVKKRRSQSYSKHADGRRSMDVSR